MRTRAKHRERDGKQEVLLFVKVSFILFFSVFELSIDFLWFRSWYFSIRSSMRLCADMFVWNCIWQMQTSKMANRMIYGNSESFARISFQEMTPLCHNNNNKLIFDIQHYPRLMKLFVFQFLKMHSQIKAKKTQSKCFSTIKNEDNQNNNTRSGKKELGTILSLKIQSKIFMMKF